MNKFKRYLSFLLLAAVLAFPVQAGANSASVTANVNYTDSTIDVTYINPLSYSTYVIFYVTEASSEVNFRDYAKAARISETLCEPGAVAAVKIKISGDLSGDYDVFAVPGGVDSASGRAKTSSPINIIGDSEKAKILNEINAAECDKIGGLIFEKLKEIIELSGLECPSWKSGYIYDMKNDDFSGSFKNFGDIKSAWECADVIHNIVLQSSPLGLATAIDAAKKIGIDTENKDYLKYKDSFLDKFMAMQTNITTKSKALALFNECAALTAVKNRDVQGKAEALSEYSDILIKTSLKSDLERVGAANVARLIGNEEFGTATDAQNKIENIIAELKTAQDNYKPGSGGGSSGGGSSGNNRGVKSESVTLPKNDDVQPANETFSDISGHWAEEAILYLAERNIINGFPNGTFQGEKPVNREEFVKIIVSAFGIKPDKESQLLSFDDVSDSFWAFDYIRSAVYAGIINGVGENMFGTGTMLSRQDSAVIIERSMKYKGISAKSGDEKTFADDKDIAYYAKDAVNSMTAAGLINGYEDSTFRPNDVLTRAEAAKLIYGVLTAEQ